MGNCGGDLFRSLGRFMVIYGMRVVPFGITIVVGSVTIVSDVRLQEFLQFSKMYW